MQIENRSNKVCILQKQYLSVKIHKQWFSNLYISSVFHQRFDRDTTKQKEQHCIPSYENGASLLSLSFPLCHPVSLKCREYNLPSFDLQVEVGWQSEPPQVAPSLTFYSPSLSSLHCQPGVSALSGNPPRTQDFPLFLPSFYNQCTILYVVNLHQLQYINNESR